MNETIKKINEKRQTVKEYSDKKISNEDWKQILSSIYWAPSSHGFEPYRVLIINKDNELRKELQPLMWNQGVVINADKLVFFISLKRSVFTNEDWLFERALRKTTNVTGVKGEEAKEAAKKQASGILNMHLNVDESNGDDWAMKQCYIALGFALNGATILNIGTTPMEGLEKTKLEPLFIKKGLLKDNERLAVAVAFGYPASEKAYAHFGSGARVRDDWDKKFKEI